MLAVKACVFMMAFLLINFHTIVETVFCYFNLSFPIYNLSSTSLHHQTHFVSFSFFSSIIHLVAGSEGTKSSLEKCEFKLQFIGKVEQKLEFFSFLLSTVSSFFLDLNNISG